MKTIKKLLILLLLFISIKSNAQLEDVIVETYYISEAADSADLLKGKLAEGSVTYRIFLDLEEGYAVRSIFGDSIHPLTIESTEPFFNHPTGSSVSYNIPSDFYNYGNMVLDSYLTLGYTDDKHIGVPKTIDPDSSVIGGENHILGMLSSENSEAGIPVKEKDGLVVASDLPSNYSFYKSFNDDTTFGTRTVSNSFTYFADFIAVDALTFKDVEFQGATEDNKVLIAQVTTRGELAFKLNCKIVSLMDSVQVSMGSSKKYIKKGTSYYYRDTLLPDNTSANEYKYSYLMSYPLVRGCTDPYFVQYNPEAGIDDGSCRDSIILGCMDITACNYDASANYHVPEICCYGPDNCDDRNIDIVCPDYQDNKISLQIFPNVVTNEFKYEVVVEGVAINNKISVYNAYGGKIQAQKLPDFTNIFSDIVDVTNLQKGIYIVTIESETKESTYHLFIKE